MGEAKDHPERFSKLSPQERDALVAGVREAIQEEQRKRGRAGPGYAYAWNLAECRKILGQLPAGSVETGTPKHVVDLPSWVRYVLEKGGRDREHTHNSFDA